MEVDARIRSSLSSVRARLADLEAHGLVRRDGSAYRYAPGPELAGAVDDLALAYAERRYTVIEQIFAKPIDKLQFFSRAFRLRRDDDG